MQELKPIKEGKVREIYDNGDSLIMVATDRISCFDVILNNEVTKKGTVLTQMSKFWFDMTEDILPNHMISVDTNDMPEFFQQERYEGKSMMCKKMNMLPSEPASPRHISQFSTFCAMSAPGNPLSGVALTCASIPPTRAMTSICCLLSDDPIREQLGTCTL